MAISARQATLQAQRASSRGLYGGGKIRLLSPQNNAVASIARSTAAAELDIMTSRYNGGEISNDEMRSFLVKMSGNMGLSNADKLQVQVQIRDFDSRIVKDRLEASYKAAPEGSLQQMQAAQAIFDYYNNRSAGMSAGTPAQSQVLQDAALWGQKVNDIKTYMAKKANQTLRYQEEAKINQLPNNSAEKSYAKAQMYKDLAARAMNDGDEVSASKYESYYQQQLSNAEQQALKAKEAEDRGKLSDLINTTTNDYHDGKISGEQALATLQEADKFAYDISDVAAQNRLNSLSITINNDIEKGVSYSSRNGLSVKSTPNKADEELYVNPDGTLSVNTRTSGSASGGLVSTEGGINPLIQKYFPKDQWVTAQAVMLAESGGNANAKGDDYAINGLHAPSYGLFQIRALPGRPDPSTLVNPEANVAYAAQMWQSQGWQPWSAYTNGSYRKYVGQAQSGGAGAIVTNTNTIQGSGGDRPKTLTELEIEYKNDLRAANDALLNGYGVVDGKKVPFAAKDYMKFVQAAAKKRQLVLQNLDTKLTEVASSGVKKIGGKAVTELIKSTQTELGHVTTEYNQIRSGNLVLAMRSGSFTDQSGNKISKPQLQFVPKANTTKDVEANGIYYPTRAEKQYFSDEKEVSKYLKDYPWLDGSIKTDDAGTYVEKSFLDVTDTEGNTVPYENHPKYGYVPVATGPISGKMREQVIKEYEQAAKEKKEYKFTPKTYNELVKFDYKTPVGTTKTVPVEPTTKDKVIAATKPVVEAVGNVVAPISAVAREVVNPTSPYKSADQMNLPRTMNTTPQQKQQLTQMQPQSGQSYQAMKPLPPLKLATQAPSPVANYAKQTKQQPVKIAPPPTLPKPKPNNAFENVIGAGGKVLQDVTRSIFSLFKKK